MTIGCVGEEGRTSVVWQLPDFPWDRLQPAKQVASAHPDGLVDLSMGTPIDSTPAIITRALAEAADAPGYPTTHGTAELRAAILDYLRRRWGVDGLGEGGVLPTIGAKELVAWLPTLLGLGIDDCIVVPALAYPTYGVGATMAGCEVVSPTIPDELDEVDELAAGRVGLVWVNSPSNPTGRVLSAAEMARVVSWARERNVWVVSDECYLEYGWESAPVSVLHPDVCGSDPAGIVAVHSLSKRSNMAGYRAGFIAGDPSVVGRLLAVRKHAGMIVPRPVQDAMAAALGDDDHVRVQRERYAHRRSQLGEAFTGAGFEVQHSDGALYLWVTRSQDCWKTVDELAELGILVTPGDVYGTAGAHHVRVAFTATDERIAAAVARLHTRAGP